MSSTSISKVTRFKIRWEVLSGEISSKHISDEEEWIAVLYDYFSKEETDFIEWLVHHTPMHHSAQRVLNNILVERLLLER